MRAPSAVSGLSSIRSPSSADPRAARARNRVSVSCRETTIVDSSSISLFKLSPRCRASSFNRPCASSGRRTVRVEISQPSAISARGQDPRSRGMQLARARPSILCAMIFLAPPAQRAPRHRGGPADRGRGNQRGTRVRVAEAGLAVPGNEALTGLFSGYGSSTRAISGFTARGNRAGLRTPPDRIPRIIPLVRPNMTHRAADSRPCGAGCRASPLLETLLASNAPAERA